MLGQQRHATRCCVSGQPDSAPILRRVPVTSFRTETDHDGRRPARPGDVSASLRPARHGG